MGQLLHPLVTDTERGGGGLDGVSVRPQSAHRLAAHGGRFFDRRPRRRFGLGTPAPQIDHGLWRFHLDGDSHVRFVHVEPRGGEFGGSLLHATPRRGSPQGTKIACDDQSRVLADHDRVDCRTLSSHTLLLIIIRGHARDHGIPDPVIEQTFRDAIECASYEHEDGTVRWVMIAVDDAGRPHEAVWVELGGGDYLAIHCQRLRRSTANLIRRLKEGR